MAANPRQQQIIVDDSVISIDETGLRTRTNGFQYNTIWQHGQSAEYFRDTVSWFDEDSADSEALWLRTDFHGVNISIFGAMGDPGPSIFVEPTFFYALDNGPAVAFSSPPVQSEPGAAVIFTLPSDLRISDSPHTLLLTNIIPPVLVDYARVDVGDTSLVANETIMVTYDHVDVLYRGPGWSRSAEGNGMESRTIGDEVTFPFCGTSMEWLGNIDRSVPGNLEVEFKIDGRTIRRETFPNSSSGAAETTPNLDSSFPNSLGASGGKPSDPLFSSDTLEPFYFYPEPLDNSDDVAAANDPRSSCWHTASLAIVSSTGSQLLSISSLTYLANFTTFATLPPLPPEFPVPQATGALPPGSTPTSTPTADPTATSVLAPPRAGPTTITTTGIILPVVVVAVGLAFWGTVYVMSRRRAAAKQRQAELSLWHGISSDPNPRMVQVVNGMSRGSSGSMKFAEVQNASQGYTDHIVSEKGVYTGGQMFPAISPTEIPRQTTYPYTPVFPLTNVYTLDHPYASYPKPTAMHTRADLGDKYTAAPVQRTWSKRKPPPTSLLLATRIATGELGNIMEEFEHDLPPKTKESGRINAVSTRTPPGNFEAADADAHRGRNMPGVDDNPRTHDSWLNLETPSPYNGHPYSDTSNSTLTPNRISTSESYAAYPRSYADRLVELIDAATIGPGDPYDEEDRRMHDYMYNERQGAAQAGRRLV